ncbi:MAG: hypothetical protein EOP49_03635 [Sphingobacteriales bacterium]|nr:MAG: hypothetical protein EOP49_03635 [Sphingobacteriales bacterium]
MKRFLLASVACLSILASCKKDETNNPVTPEDTDMNVANLARTSNTTNFTEPSSDTLQGEIKTNTVLKTGKTYVLRNFVYVKNGATLKMEPGVTIKGDKTTKGTLIITRDGRIDAQGTSSSPVVFTSNESTPNIGDWGGLIILGNAKTNGSYNGTSGLQEIEGGVNNDKGFGLHGGADDDDNSGIIKYVRVEFAGIAFQPNNEINGITFGSVGRGTTVDYVQVAYCGDDSYEFFGGTVNCKHLIAYRGTDDDFDTDNGYSGKVQFGIALRDPNVADFATGGSSNGFESDNDASGSAAMPKTSAVFSNMTMIGPWAQGGTVASPFKRGAHIRRNSSISIFNSVFAGWNTGILIDGSSTATNVASNGLEVMNTLIAGANKSVDTVGLGASGSLNPSAWFLTASSANVVKATTPEAMIANPDLVNFNPAPFAGSPALSGAGFVNGKLIGLSNTTYIGAAAAGDAWWTGGWARFWNK